MNEQQAKQKLHHDRSRVQMRDFAASDSVSVRNMQGTYAKWLPGTVIYAVWRSNLPSESGPSATFRPHTIQHTIQHRLFPTKNTITL